MSATLGVGLGVTDRARLSTPPGQGPRLIFVPIAFRQQAAADGSGIRIQLALAPQAAPALGARSMPRPSPIVVAREAAAPAPRLIDAALVSDGSTDRTPPPAADIDAGWRPADYRPTYRIADEDLPPPEETRGGEQDYYGENDR